MYGKCCCKHDVKDHVFDVELEAFYECKMCECEGFDLPEYSEATELPF